MHFRTAALLSIALASPVAADEFAAAAEEFYRSSVATWAADPRLVAAITEQNNRTTGYTQAEIDALDQAWRAEVGMSDAPTITPVLTSELSEFLREQVAQSGGRITEVFVMDGVGLNVATSDVTSDFWQGDEEKFTETFGQGPGAIHVSEIELDESTQRYQGQVSVTIVDPASGLPIGAMTVGVDAESLM
ncbi:hypothetical protein GQ651_03045 [Alphaproteobacteria bacterium GH1-50]|uniref:Uncharacterized protein n=1 Tax=Kangsaoukella pontilimi TaxID=2691042 RepID=A0A7C9MIC2_9RHOB|nr:hypothetical protein [Kangsaoukella pontilimi]MXQ06815.1 hypothetical protein [Kangsaoukella pontilimi]